MTTHSLECWPQHWQAIQEGRKTLEIRWNDRNYQDGDVLILREYDPEIYSGGWVAGGPDGDFTGRVIKRRVSHVLRDGQFGLSAGYVALSLTDVEDTPVITPGAHEGPPWRQDEKLPHRVYAQRGPDPDRRAWPDGDTPIGMFPNPDDAARAVEAVNAVRSGLCGETDVLRHKVVMFRSEAQHYRHLFYHLRRALRNGLCERCAGTGEPVIREGEKDSEQR